MTKDMLHSALGSGASIFRRRCLSNAVLDMIADKWTAMILSLLSEGNKRHGELLSSIDGLSQRMLTQTLRDLERNGLVRRTVYPTVPLRVDYELTDLGRDLYLRAVKPMCEWATEHMADVVAARQTYEQREI